MKKSLFGLGENIVSALAYVGFFVTGIIVYILERENKTVRFNALQSTILFVPLCALWWICKHLLCRIWLINIISGPVSALLGIFIFLCWLFLTFSAYKGMIFKIPIIGDAVWEHVNK